MELRAIPAEDGFIQNLSHAIGFLAVQFGLFEFTLNGCIGVIHQRIVPPVGKRRKLPYGLTDRLQYVRNAIRDYAALGPYKDELLELMTLAERLASTRNGALHGYPADYDPDTHALTFVGAEPSKDDKTIHRFTKFVITLIELDDHGDRAQDLATKMVALTHRMVDELGNAQGVFSAGQPAKP